MCILEHSRTFVKMGLSHLMNFSEPGRKPLSIQARSPACLRAGGINLSKVLSGSPRLQNGMSHQTWPTPPVALQSVDPLCCLKPGKEMKPLSVLLLACGAASPFSFLLLKSLLWPPASHSPSTAPECWVSHMPVPPHLALAQGLYLKLHLGPEPGPI